jgi:hypothetical protein
MGSDAHLRRGFSMPMISPRDATIADLADRLEMHIARRTCGQVRDLRVLTLEDRVVLRGRSRTYHVKQLAQEAALDETGGWAVLVNEIEVY